MLYYYSVPRASFCDLYNAYVTLLFRSILPQCPGDCNTDVLNGPLSRGPARATGIAHLCLNWQSSDPSLGCMATKHHCYHSYGPPTRSPQPLPQSLLPTHTCATTTDEAPRSAPERYPRAPETRRGEKVRFGLTMYERLGYESPMTACYEEHWAKQVPAMLSFEPARVCS